MQASLPLCGLYVPAPQPVHRSLALEIVPLNPASHSQSVKATLFVDVVLDWSGHKVQSAAPGADLYCPTAQAAHVSDADLIAPTVPGIHRHADTSVLAVAVVVESAGQAVHAGALGVPDPRYEPTAHAVHVSLVLTMTPECPAVHLHVLTSAAASATVVESAGHATHVALPRLSL